MSIDHGCCGCDKIFPADTLNYSPIGQVCDACLLDLELQQQRPGLSKVLGPLALGLVLVGTSWMVSSRDVRTTSFSFGGETTETVRLGMDTVGLALAMFAVFALLAALSATRAAKPRDGARFFQPTRALYAGAGLVLLIASGARVYDAFPRATETITVQHLPGPREKCDAGDSSACNDLGVSLKRDGKVQAALKLFDRSCELGYGLACHNLGIASSNLEPPDWRAAGSGYLLACRLGHPNACLSAITTTSKHLPENTPSLRAELRELCDRQVRESCTAYGATLALGLGGHTDSVQAMKLFEPECWNADVGLACWNLAVGYRDGVGVETDYDMFYALEVRACELGYSQAC